MLTRWFPALAAGCLLATAVPAPAAESEKPEPTFVARVRSLDALIEDAKYVATLAGGGEVAKQVEGIIKARIGEKGLDGIDTTRPLGFYATVGGGLDDTVAVAMLPIKDEKALLGLLKGLKLDAEKGKDGLYTVRPDFLPVEVYFRIVNKYAYVTAINADAIAEKKLLDPATVKPEGASTLASASLYINRIPDAIKQIALSQLEARSQQVQEQKPPRETEAQEAFRVRVLKDLTAAAAAVIKDGKELTFKFEVDRKAGKLAAVYSLTGKSGSALEKEIGELAKMTSLFGGLLGTDTAAGGLVHFTLPRDVRKTLGPVVDEGLKQLAKREQDETKRALAERFLKALAPSLKSGELDALVNLRGPGGDGKYTLIAALKLKDGTAVEKVVRDLVKLAPETERAKIKMDAARAGEVAIHEVTIKDNTDKGVKKLFGEGPLYFAFREDAVLVTLGEDGLAALKAAVAAKGKASPMIRFEMSLARLAPLIRVVSKNDAVGKMAAKFFREDAKDPGRVRISLAGGDALTARVTVSAAVIKFLGQAAVKGAAAQEPNQE